MEKIAGKPAVLKLANHQLIKDAIRNNPMISRPQLAQLTGLSLVTVNKIVNALEQSGEIICQGVDKSTGGRKAKHYCMNENFGLMAAVLVRDGRFNLSLLDAAGSPIYRKVIDYNNGGWTNELVDAIDSLVKLKEGYSLLAVGVAVPGTVYNGAVANIPSIPEWEEYKLLKALEKHYSCTVVIENDIKVCAVSAYESYGGSESSMLLLYLSSGIGAGIVLNGKLYKSGRAFAGELGYLPVEGKEKRLEPAFAMCVSENNKPEMQKLVAQVLAATSCLIDPDITVIDSVHLFPEDLEQIRKKCAHYIGKRYLPRLVLAHMDNAAYHKGLFLLCQQSRAENICIYT